MDVTAPGVLYGRTWLWLRRQIVALLTAPPQVVADRWGRVHMIPQTRLGLVLAPPDFSPPSGAGRTPAADTL